MGLLDDIKATVDSASQGAAALGLPFDPNPMHSPALQQLAEKPNQQQTPQQTPATPAPQTTGTLDDATATAARWKQVAIVAGALAVLTIGGVLIYRVAINPRKR